MLKIHPFCQQAKIDSNLNVNQFVPEMCIMKPNKLHEVNRIEKKPGDVYDLPANQPTQSGPFGVKLC